MAKRNKVVAFCCENSAHKAVSSIRTAAVVRSVELVKVPCTGAIEAGDILKRIEKGAARVLVIGCPIDNCKYINGNLRAHKRIKVVRQALKDAGIEEDRVRMEFISSMDTHRLTDLLKEMRRV